MSIHIGAKDNEIAEVVLLPGDPLRAEHIAATFFEEAVCYSRVRGMLGFTGRYKGKRVSVQGTGMGVPSISIYAHELLHQYGATTLVRVGTCGALQPSVKVRDLILAMSASTDSAVNRIRFPHVDYAPTANFELLLRAYHVASEKGFNIHVGNILTSDTFYSDDQESTNKLIDHGTLAVEMESAALYTLAAKAKARALSILTVSDHVITGESTTSEERQTTFDHMIEVALEASLFS